MDETEGDSRYLPNYGVNQGYESTKRSKVTDNYVDLDEADEEQEEDEEQELGHDSSDTDDEDDNFNQHRHPKKRKLKSLLSSFEIVPRVTAPPPLAVLPPPRAARPSFGGRNTLTDWSEQETFALLEAWGERFLQRGRKSLRSEEWQEVAQKVSLLKFERTDTQCRNRLDTLKKKYKKEKALFAIGKQTSTKWVYFKKMDMLMSSTPPPQQVSPSPTAPTPPTAPAVYFDNTGPADDEDDDDDDDDSDLVPMKKSNKRVKEKEKVIRRSFKLLADSINKFSDIYEKIETRKRKQMVELEKMRMDFHKELELQKKQIFDRARDQITKMRQGDYEKNDSAENISG